MNRNEFVEDHYRKNYKLFVNRMTNRVPHKSKDLAEEVVQEAYSLALKYWKAFNPEIGRFDAWFNRILNNACNRCVQLEGGGTLSLDDEYDLEPFFLNEDMDIPQEVVIIVQEAIKKEPPDRSEVLNMFFNLGMKTREIEECTSYSHSNIRQIIRRFRIKWGDENIF